eukprot:scaffold153783_cov35-Tisochrysis_lutea.AAC.1
MGAQIEAKTQVARTHRKPVVCRLFQPSPLPSPARFFPLMSLVVQLQRPPFPVLHRPPYSSGRLTDASPPPPTLLSSPPCQAGLALPYAPSTPVASRRHCRNTELGHTAPLPPRRTLSPHLTFSPPFT